MCDFEELELEDFELMLDAISKMSRARTEQEAPKAPIPQVVLARQRR